MSKVADRLVNRGEEELASTLEFRCNINEKSFVISCLIQLLIFFVILPIQTWNPEHLPREAKPPWCHPVYRGQEQVGGGWACCWIGRILILEF